MVQNLSVAQRSADRLKIHTHAQRHDTPLAFHRSERQDSAAERLDYFVREDGQEFAGRHLLIDLWGATKLDDIAEIEAALRESVEACGATLLHIHLHEFSPNGGISGVAVLAESHISVHTWPERGFAAFDVFMCGQCRPENAVPVLERRFTPSQVALSNQRRGLVE